MAAPLLLERYVPRLSREGDVHCIPNFKGERRHLQSEICWCGPVVEAVGENGRICWVHHRPH